MAHYDSRARSHDHYDRHDLSTKTVHTSGSRHDRNKFLSVTGTHGEHQSRSRSRRRHTAQTSRSPSLQRRRSRSSRKRWPPHPIVEDEVVALAKEYRPQYSKSEDDVESRGSIDQDPLMIELISSDTRFVWQSASQTSDPESKASNEALKMRLRGRHRASEVHQANKSSLRLETSPSALLEERRPSPYSFSRNSAAKLSTSDYVMSPESIAPRLASSVPQSLARKDNERRDARKKGSSGSSDANYSSRSDFSEDSDVDPREIRRKREAHVTRSARPSLAGARSRNSSSQYENWSDTDSDRRRQEQLKPRPRPISRISTRLEPMDDRSKTPKASLLNPPDLRREPPRHATIPGAVAPAPRPASAMAASSPRSNTVPTAKQTPHSPRAPSYVIPHDSPIDRIATSSKHNYAARTTSIPTAPQPSSGILLDKSDRRPPAHQRSSSQSALPYPDADMFVSMPTAQSFMDADSGRQHIGAAKVSRDSSLHSGLSSSSLRRNPDELSSASQRSSGQDVPIRARQSSSIKANQPSRSMSSSTSASNESYVLPACPRRNFTNKYDDWWSLESFPTFDVCPDCLADIIRPTQFRRRLVPAPRRPPNVSIRCDFGSPWIRLAWLLCKKRELQEGSLVLKLAEQWETSLPCSEEHQAHSTEWWGLVDKTLYFVPGFRVCARDKQNIETLFPSLEGAFTKLPGDAAPTMRTRCAMRSDNRRLGQYLDLMDRVHDRAVFEYVRRSATSSSLDIRPRRLNGTADARPLIDLAADLARRPECPADRPTTGMKWHCVADYPDITVCPDCYEDVIAPDVQGSAAIARLFTTTPQSIDHLSTAISPTSRTESPPPSLTCQLYSSRMRRIWDHAASHDDAEYMLRKLRERRAKEVQLRRQRTELVRLLQQRSSADMTYTGGGTSRELLLRDLDKVEQQWHDYE